MAPPRYFGADFCSPGVDRPRQNGGFGLTLEPVKAPPTDQLIARFMKPLTPMMVKTTPATTNATREIHGSM